ncbi:MAG: SusF/SusE family outer membrane protein [Candidatus Cyclobacteriaceae bacterium M2_1C_046]
MKNISLILLSFFLLLGFSACEDDVALDFVAEEPAEDLEFTNSFLSEYVISEPTASNIAERFIWEPVDFGAPVNITYELYGSTDPTFGTSQLLGSTSENHLAVSVDQLLDLATEAGLDGDPATPDNSTGELYFRLRAFTGTGGANTIEKFSAIQPIQVRWVEVGGEEPPLRNLFFVGNATAAGWDPNNNNTPLFRDPSNPDLYYFTGKFAAGEFKLVEVRGQWQPQWGTNDGTTLAVNDGTGSDPGAFVIETEGYYSLTVDTDAMTFTVEPYDASGDPTYSTIGIIGDATPGGWDADTDMTQSTFNPHIWYINGAALGGGEMKFRAEDAWDVNWGAGTPISGEATQNGPNIPVEAGTYDIWFNDITGRYIFLLVE